MGGTALFTETQVVIARSGDITIYLGAVAALDLSIFKREASYLGITLMGEEEMQPRLEIGSVPFAAYAQDTAALPSGAIMMFDLNACPPGWSALDAARGRALVGMPANGTRGGVVGTALSNLENRPHAHAVDFSSIRTTADGKHTHSVAIPASSTGPAGAHSHAWSHFNPNGSDSEKIWSSWNALDAAVEVMGWGNGIGNDGTDIYPFAVGTRPSSVTYYTNRADSHSHALSAATAQAAEAPSHSHGIDLPEQATTSIRTSDVVPYLQLLVCRKT